MRSNLWSHLQGSEGILIAKKTLLLQPSLAQGASSSLRWTALSNKKTCSLSSPEKEVNSLHPPAKGKCNVTCSRKPIKAKKVRAEEWVNWLRLSTQASASEGTHSPSRQPRQSRETQRQLCWCLSSQKSFRKKRLFDLPTKCYHVWEGNTAVVSNSQHFMTGKKILQSILQMVVKICPSLTPPCTFNLGTTLLQHCVNEGVEQGQPFLCHTGE